MWYMHTMEYYSTIKKNEFEQAPGMGDAGKPGVLQSMGSQRVEHD